MGVRPRSNPLTVTSKLQMIETPRNCSVLTNCRDFVTLQNVALCFMYDVVPRSTVKPVYNDIGLYDTFFYNVRHSVVPINSSTLQKMALCFMYNVVSRSTVKPGYNDTFFYNVRHSVVPINSSLLVITLYSPLITTLVYDATMYSVP